MVGSIREQNFARSFKIFIRKTFGFQCASIWFRQLHHHNLLIKMNSTMSIYFEQPK